MLWDIHRIMSRVDSRIETTLPPCFLNLLGFLFSSVLSPNRIVPIPNRYSLNHIRLDLTFNLIKFWYGRVWFGNGSVWNRYCDKFVWSAMLSTVLLIHSKTTLSNPWELLSPKKFNFPQRTSKLHNSKEIFLNQNKIKLVFIVMSEVTCSVQALNCCLTPLNISNINLPINQTRINSDYSRSTMYSQLWVTVWYVSWFTIN